MKKLKIYRRLVAIPAKMRYTESILNYCEMTGMKLSLVVPCYNEAENVAAFQEAVIGAFEGCGYDYEIVFVDDGSRDATLHNLKKLTTLVGHFWAANSFFKLWRVASRLPSSTKTIS